MAAEIQGAMEQQARCLQSGGRGLQNSSWSLSMATPTSPSICSFSFSLFFLPLGWRQTLHQIRCKSAAASIWFGDGNASFTEVYCLFSVVTFTSTVNLCIKCPTFSYSQFFFVISVHIFTTSYY
jgi:hypothetical protein